jgi:hypothetical protein
MTTEDAASADQSRPSGNAESQQWAIQRRIDDVFAKLGEKFGNLTGRVLVQMKPETTFRPDRRPARSQEHRAELRDRPHRS